MKYKAIFTIILLVVVSLVLSWGMAAIVRKAIVADDDVPYKVTAQEDKWHTVASWLFPMYVDFSDKGTGSLVPELKINFGVALFISHLMFFAYLFTVGRKNGKRKIPMRLANAFVIILFGIPGLIASLIIK
jgi:hypothetical protein